MRYLTPIPKQFVDQSGIPYSDGTVSVYLSGSDELADIFEDAEGDALCPNPCRLDSNGAWQCFVPGDIPLDYIVQDKHGNVVFPYYNIVPASGDGGVFTVKGTEGEIKVTNRVTASGRREATVGLDTAFKQRVDQVEDDIGDLNEEMRGVEGSIQELNEDVDHLDDRVEEAEGQIDQLSESLAEKKDRQTPVVVGNIPANKTVKRISQNANGEIDVETQDIEFPGADLVNINSPEGTLEVSKTAQTGRQDFDMDVADHSLETKKMKVDQFHYIDVDHVTLESEQDGHTMILKVKDGSMYPNLDVMQNVIVVDPTDLVFEDGKCYNVANYTGSIDLATDSTDTIHCKLIISAAASTCSSVTLNFIDEANNNLSINIVLDSPDLCAYMFDMYMKKVGEGMSAYTICRIYDYPVRSRSTVDDSATYSLVGRVI